MMASPGMSSAPASYREPVGPVQPIAGEDLLSSAVEVDLDAVAIVLDFMKPLVALGSLRLQGGELGLNEPRHGLKYALAKRNSQKSPPHLEGQAAFTYFLKISNNQGK